MSGHVILVASRDRAASGRAIAGMLAAGLFGAGALIVQFGLINVPLAALPVEPPQVTTRGGHHHVVVRGDEFGERYIDGWVNGSLVRRMLLDSGAGGHLTFGSNHAAQLGFEPSTLSYSGSYESANGVGREAFVRVRELRLFGDSFILRGNVPAVITKARQSQALVGIETLRRLNYRLVGRDCELSW
jgi:clan AA aspartic protease (TIGR02281 family)